jgi:hypothetical protein
MEWNETLARELIISLAMQCEAFFIEVNAYRVTVDTSFPQAKKAVHERVREITKDPGPDIREAAGQRYAECFACATAGLDDQSAQKLMDRVRAEMEAAAEDNTPIN